MLLFGLLCFAVRVADACGSKNEWGNGHENNMLCPGAHRDGVPDGQCYGASAVPNGCCFAVTSYGEHPSCSDPAYSPVTFEAAYTWPIGNWKAYGCCKPHVPYEIIIGGSVGGVVLIAIIIFVICKCSKRRTAQPHANVPGGSIQMLPQVQPQQVQPQMHPQDIPIVQVPAPVMGNPKGRFDVYTGKENPKFDPETGVQNW